MKLKESLVVVLCGCGMMVQHCLALCNVVSCSILTYVMYFHGFTFVKVDDCDSLYVPAFLLNQLLLSSNPLISAIIFLIPNTMFLRVILIYPILFIPTQQWVSDIRMLFPYQCNGCVDLIVCCISSLWLEWRFSAFDRGMYRRLVCCIGCMALDLYFVIIKEINRMLYNFIC